ncbi:MAG: PAS domain-containing protein [Candidatus Zixiibacteriota bacterium]|nr:MAG: PAS domain-containing protein [candidate division Zixibacteria bacterium]
MVSPMRLRHKFILFVILIHIVLLALSLLLIGQNKYLFIVSEVVIVISIVISLHLYRGFLQPLNLITAGIESIKDKDFSTTLVATGHREIDELIEVYNRMIEQLRSERIRQREQHFFLEHLIEATPSGVLILDLDGRISMVNPSAADMIGRKVTELIGRPVETLGEWCGIALEEMIPGQTIVVNRSGLQTFRFSKSRFVDRGFHRHFILIEELTKEIAVSQKRAYDKVIRMMSHEINNSIGAVNSILDSCANYRTQLAPEDSSDFSGAIQVAIDRNNRLNRFMANFANVVRTPLPTKEPHDLHELLRSVAVLMSAECSRRSINWQWDLARSPFVVEIDVEQMEQVLLNTMKNAVEAIDHDGTITIRTSGPDPRMLWIIDTGKGILPGERAQLFTPFYSTKKDGQGIGLTLTREILINHGFRFDLESSGKGHTEFWIEFAKPNC